MGSSVWEPPITLNDDTRRSNAGPRLGRDSVDDSASSRRPGTSARPTGDMDALFAAGGGASVGARPMAMMSPAAAHNDGG